MGMFDYVHFAMDCPTCGTIVSNFQSKDGPCDLKTIEPDGLNNFYTSCKNCSSRIDFVHPSYDMTPSREVMLTKEEVEAMGFVMYVRVRKLSI